jgi:hypothetical protein
MNRSLLSLSVVAAITACNAPPIPIFGEWIVDDHVAPGPSSMTKADADRFRGLRLSYSANRAVFLDRSCDRPVYERWNVSARHFESDYGVPPRRVGVLADSIPIVRIDCTVDGQALGNEVVVVSADKLIFVSGGVFFLLSRLPP